MKNILIIVTLLICTFLIIMAVTAPNREDHLIVITQNYKNYVDDSNSDDIPLLGMLLDGYRESYFENEMDKRFKLKNYVIFSVGKIDSTAISFGAFGNVYITTDFLLEEE